MNRYIAALLIPIALAACSTAKPPATTAAPIQESKPAEPKTPPPAAQMNSMSNADTEATKLAEKARLARELASKLEKESVYFDFDKSVVKPEFADTVKQQADFMLGNSNDAVELEGNCDERGSDEYNLALGERRATAVSKQLQILGVAKGRIKTISYGEERPRLTCHEEKCWKENRRVDFKHQLN
jgi:peptidoglycan-associated lipoprotein